MKIAIRNNGGNLCRPFKSTPFNHRDEHRGFWSCQSTVKQRMKTFDAGELLGTATTPQRHWSSSSPRFVPRAAINVVANRQDDAEEAAKMASHACGRSEQISSMCSSGANDLGSVQEFTATQGPPLFGALPFTAA